MKPPKYEETDLVRLSEDVMEEILSRVPVKSLVKLRCVSKSWCHLIDDKRFVKTHLQNSIKNSSFAHRRIILNTWEGLGQCSLPLLLLNEPFTTDSITYNNEFIHVEVGMGMGMIRLVGCCNGLVCILVDRRRRFILWNPATRKSRNLPDFDNNMEDRWIRKYGFGLDEVENDYKVFALTNDKRYGKVYSLRSNSWKVVVEGRDINDSNYKFYCCANMGIYASGKLHWYVHYKREIASFDLNSHVYGLVEHPPYLEVKSRSSYRLHVHNGCLIVLGTHRQQTDSKFVIWVMKEYGVKETWHKLVTVPFSKAYVPYGFNLVAIAPNGEVLLTYSSILKIYNPKYNLFRYPEIMNYDRIIESGIYIESLASIDPDSES